MGDNLFITCGESILIVCFILIPVYIEAIFHLIGKIFLKLYNKFIQRLELYLYLHSLYISLINLNAFQYFNSTTAVNVTFIVVLNNKYMYFYHHIL